MRRGKAGLQTDFFATSPRDKELMAKVETTTAIAVNEKFALNKFLANMTQEIPAEVAATRAMLAAEFDPAEETKGLSYRFTQVKVSHPNQVFMFPTDGGELQFVKTFNAVIFASEERRAYWEEGTVFPVCWGYGQTPDAGSAKKQAEHCSQCPHAVFKGACKQILRLALLLPDGQEPYELNLKVTSKPGFIDYIKQVGMLAGYSMKVVVAEFSLARAEDDKHNVYSKLVIRPLKTNGIPAAKNEKKFIPLTIVNTQDEAKQLKSVYATLTPLFLGANMEQVSAAMEDDFIDAQDLMDAPIDAEGHVIA